MVFQYIEKALPKKLRKDFGKAALRAYYAEFAGMLFFLGISVGCAVGSKHILNEYEKSFLTELGTCMYTSSRHTKCVYVFVFLAVFPS